MPPLFAPQPAAFGLDISDSSVKVALLRKHGRTVMAEHVFAAPIPDGLIVEGEIKDVPGVASALRRILEPLSKSLPIGVVTALPESKTFLETITVEKQENGVLADRLLEVLPEYLPLPPDEVYRDSALI